MAKRHRTALMDATSPMTAVVVIDGLGAGGAERSLAELAEPLRQRGVELVVAYAHDRGVVEASLRDAGATMVLLNARTVIGRGLQLRRLVRRLRPDLVHATLVVSSLMTRVALVGTGTPVLTSIVNTTYTPPAPLGRPGLRRGTIRLVDGWTARHLTAGVHAISGAAADDAVRNLGIDRRAITIIPRGRGRARLGWPSPERRVRARVALAVPADTELVVCVGRQEPQKRHDVLIGAWRAIAAARPHARLLVAGRPGRATPLVERAIAELDDDARARVTLLGHIEQVGDLMAAADVFVFPSDHEGLGGAVVEALALGLPIVASDLPVFAEYLDRERNAVLVAPGDPAAIAAAVIDLLADPQRRADMARVNAERFAERFELEPIADRMFALYRKTAAVSAARRADRR